MSVNRGYKYELQVNNKERTRLAMYAGTARFTWNWGLAQRLKHYKENEGNDRYTDAMKQHKELNVLKSLNLLGCTKSLNVSLKKRYVICRGLLRTFLLT